MLVYLLVKFPIKKKEDIIMSRATDLIIKNLTNELHVAKAALQHITEHGLVDDVADNVRRLVHLQNVEYLEKRLRKVQSEQR